MWHPGFHRRGSSVILVSRLTDTCFLCCVSCVQLHLFLPIFESYAAETEKERHTAEHMWTSKVSNCENLVAPKEIANKRIHRPRVRAEKTTKPEALPLLCKDINLTAVVKKKGENYIRLCGSTETTSRTLQIWRHNK